MGFAPESIDFLLSELVHTLFMSSSSEDPYIFHRLIFQVQYIAHGLCPRVHRLFIESALGGTYIVDGFCSRIFANLLIV